MLLAQLIQMLEQEEQELIRLRYFEEQTQVQVAARMGMTQVQVSRAEKRILRKMREVGAFSMV
jgi:RNA polymerase sporulation-specific sigma factor